MIVEGTNISMIKGDTEVIEVSCRDIEGNPVPFENGDKVYLTVKTSTNTAEKILQKVVTDFIDGIACIEIQPKDTKELLCRAYVYDIQLTRADGSVKTIIPPSSFIVRGEVTYE